MVIGFIIGSVFMVAMMAVLVFLVLNITKSSKTNVVEEKKALQRKAGACGGIVVVLFIAFLIIPFSFQTVNAGEYAVVKSLGKITGSRSAGTRFDFWILNEYKLYDAKVQEINISTEAYTNDSQVMKISLTVQFQIDVGSIEQIEENYGDLSPLSSRIESVVVERTKSILSKYKAEQIISDRANMSSEVEQSVFESIGESYYVILQTAVLTDITFSDAFESAVEDKMIAEQDKLKAEYENQMNIAKAEAELEIIKTEAEANIERAKGEAEAVILLANAEADSLKVKSISVARMLGFSIIETVDGDSIIYEIDFEGKSEESIKAITDYLKYIEYLEAWNGELPSTFLTEGGASIILPLPNESNT